MTSAAKPDGAMGRGEEESKETSGVKQSREAETVLSSSCVLRVTVSRTKL